MAEGSWPHLIQVTAEAAVEPPPGAILESRLDSCERAYRVGNPFAISTAIDICTHEKRPLPAWVIEAIKSLIAKDLDRRPAIFKRIQADMTHLRRMEHVLMEIDSERRITGKKLPLPDAFARAIARLGPEMAASKDPYRLIEGSYNEGLRIANDPDRSAFLAPHVSEVLLHHFAQMTARKGGSRKKSSELP